MNRAKLQGFALFFTRFVVEKKRARWYNYGVREKTLPAEQKVVALRSE